ncbi:argininosuccinate lyase [Caldicoprobacter guelmensis]|uniref:argininosuccinate lyase n=1 Tax=Caldicoprobacter guelmensis TaxID=1170224 RepID=UPI00195E9776|nr:argininosuccinate lyase [Caldicoprobacter guelmensis]MBM7582312.1 argininosuccinate lyase [Caldicoprobacter guelmensis]
MKLWGGRFEKETSKEVDDFHSSIHFDYRLYKQDILGSIAHATMLGKQGIISPEEAQAICEGLKQILKDIEDGKVSFNVASEDIHMNIESLLIERIGDVGKKLHTARSRNDQVALDTRMYTKEAIDEVIKLLLVLEEQLVTIAEKHKETIMPGYTHLQKAQPVTLGHHLMAYFEMFRRDIERLKDAFKRVDVMPLGSGALAGTTYPLDRQYVAEQLGFSSISRNSMDAVADRDFILEFLSCAAIIMMHLSRFCEELILWSTDEFKFIEMDDSYSTGSSIMPQKKNPDVAELIRGKTGRVYGDLIALLTTMKGLPLAYNKDMQEDKEALFDAVDTVKSCISVFTGMLSTIKVYPENMLKQAARGFINATDAADYLVTKGVPFRDAHHIVGRLVLYCIQNGKVLEELTLEEYRQFSDKFDQDIYDVISLKSCVSRRSLPGGPAPAAVSQAIEEARRWIEGQK